MDKPHVSIVIPAHNSADYIRQTLDSVSGQTYASHETIVIDDGSTDETRHVLDPYRSAVRYAYQDNGGVSAARNHGLRLARGEYVVFLDADDLLLPTKLSDQVAFLDEHPAVGCVHSGWHLIDRQGQWLGTVEPWRDAPKLDLETWLRECPVYLPAMMIRRRWLERTGGFDPTLRQAEDVDIVLRLSLIGCVTAWLYQPTVRYRQRENSLTRNGPQQAESITRVMANFFARPDLPPQIRQLANEIRLNTVFWCVWHLYRTGYTAHIAEYLRQSLTFRDDPPLLAAQYWLQRLATACHNDGIGIQELRTVWPLFKEAAQVDESLWHHIEESLDRWMKFLVVLHANPRRCKY